MTTQEIYDDVPSKPEGRKPLWDTIASLEESSPEPDLLFSLPVPIIERPLGHAKQHRAHASATSITYHAGLDDHDYPLATSMSRMSISPKQPARSLELSIPVSPLRGYPKIRIPYEVLTPVTADFDGTTSINKNPVSFAQLYFSDSPPSRSSSFTGSPTSTGSPFEWHTANLLTLSDSVRTTLRESGIQSISATDLTRLEAMLDRFLLDEVLAMSVELDTIVKGRIDKLLGALCDERKTILQESQLKTVVEKASSLLGKWKLRFGIKYKRIEQDRLTSLRHEGYLHKMSLAQEAGQERTAGKSSPNLHLEVGKWWPSLEHVFCDRVVKSLDEVVTPGKNSVFWVLPMLTGTEEDGPTVGTYKFMREGPERDMHNVLMVAASKKIRVLRGHTLKSNYAPTAGIRYDGEYMVERYCRPPTQDPKVQKMALLLRRLDGQISVNDIRNIPSPCQIDDWNLYYKNMGDTSQPRRGDEACSKWVRDVNEKSNIVID